MEVTEAKSLLEADKQARAKQAEAEFLQFVAELAKKYQCTIKPVIIANVDDSGVTRYTSVVRFDSN